MPGHRFRRAATRTRRHPEARALASLEGWKQARLWPSFETPRKSAAP
jgi:hypothetical protein